MIHAELHLRALGRTTSLGSLSLRHIVCLHQAWRMESRPAHRLPDGLVCVSIDAMLSMANTARGHPTSIPPPNFASATLHTCIHFAQASSGTIKARLILASYRFRNALRVESSMQHLAALALNTFADRLAAIPWRPSIRFRSLLVSKSYMMQGKDFGHIQLSMQGTMHNDIRQR